MGHPKYLTLQSKLLENTPSKEPADRTIAVYVPEVIQQAKPSQKFPSVYILTPWTSAGRTYLQWQPFKESLPERIERLISQGAIAPAVFVVPDLFTRFGGSQFINSTYFGPHATFILEEVIPFIESNFPVLPGAQHRAVMGRSSGGFGALRFAMDYKDSFAAVAAHSPDLDFALMFRSDLITLCKKCERHDFSPKAYWQHVMKQPKWEGSDIHALMLLGCAGFYSPNPESELGFDLPIDLWSGAINEPIWQQWLAHDPLKRIQDSFSNLKRLSCLYLECGLYDQYNLLYGARQFHQKLTELSLNHHYEEFPDNHSGTDYRFDISLPLIIKAISP